MVDYGPKILAENSRNKQFINFQLSTEMSSALSHQDVIHPFIQSIHAIYATR